ncbi:MAG: hypothetical protein QOJ58_5363, partial [Alphaproteobacteria bacterium]|nr:hypothetical protein [Alphaproteobacteria bacterium]
SEVAGPLPFCGDDIASLAWTLENHLSARYL